MGALMVYDLRWDLDDFKLDLHIGVTAIDDIVISGINTTSVKSPQTASAYCFGFIASDVWEVKAERIHRNIILNIIIQRVEVRRHVFQIFTLLCLPLCRPNVFEQKTEKKSIHYVSLCSKYFSWWHLALIRIPARLSHTLVLKCILFYLCENIQLLYILRSTYTWRSSNKS